MHACYSICIFVADICASEEVGCSGRWLEVAVTRIVQAAF